jgi:hypothetical protein
MDKNGIPVQNIAWATGVRRGQFRLSVLGSAREDSESASLRYEDSLVAHHKLQIAEAQTFHDGEQ